nr:hypothetical protein [Cellulosimicrobium arenosum]
MGRLARDAGLGKTSVADHLNTLEAKGWVVRDRPSTEAAMKSHERTRYRLVIPDPVREADSPPVREADRSGRRTGGGPGGGQDPVREADTTSTSSISSSISSPPVGTRSREEEAVTDEKPEPPTSVTAPLFDTTQAVAGYERPRLAADDWRPTTREFEDALVDFPDLGKVDKPGVKRLTREALDTLADLPRPPDFALAATDRTSRDHRRVHGFWRSYVENHVHEYKPTPWYEK